MPVRRSADYSLNGRDYMLQRTGSFRGRAWRRAGEVNVPGGPTTSSERGVTRLPDQIDFAEVWDDWSEGYGWPFRDAKNPDTYDWAQDFDARFPHQLVHAQTLASVSGLGGFGNDDPAEAFINAPAATAGVPPENLPAGHSAVILLNTSTVAQVLPIAAASFSVPNTSGVQGARHGHRAAIFGSFLYIPQVNGSPFLRLSLDSGFAFTSSPIPAKALAVAGNRLWRAFGPGRSAIYLNSTADTVNVMTTGPWSATLSVGDGNKNITDMVALGGQLFVGAADGVYAGDQGGTFYNVLNDLGYSTHPDNARDLSVHQGRLMIPHSTGVYAYRPSTETALVTQVGLPQPSTRSPVQGRVRCGTPLGQWWYGGLWTGSASFIVAGRSNEAQQPYTWHVLQRLPQLARIHRIHFDACTSNSGGTQIPIRCWVATDASFGAGGSPPRYYFPVPAMNGNPLTSDIAFSPNYNGSARIELGSTDRGAPAARKLYRLVELWAESLLSGAQYADVYYMLDRGTRTLLGRAQTSPVSQLYFLSDPGSFAIAREIQLSLESFTGSRGTTPVYRSIILHGAILADSVDTIMAETRIADNLSDRQATRMRPGALMLSELRALASPSFGPVQLIDLAGATQLVKVLPPIEETEVYQPGTENPEINATVKMAVLTFTTG